MSKVAVVVRPETRKWMARALAQSLGTRLRLALRLLDRSRCEFALLRSFDARLGWGPPVLPADELLARTAGGRTR